MILSLKERTSLQRPEPGSVTRSSPDRVVSRHVQLSAVARYAMLQELDTTPKPGLVDRSDQGAHADMDYACFRRSIEAVVPYFAATGALAAGKSPDEVLWRKVRKIGCEAETAMFSATGGVNTHKGQIFVLMLLVAAASSEGASGIPGLQKGIRIMTRGMVYKELGNGLHNKNELSHGERLFLSHGITGVRGEAEAGFPVIFECGLPVYTAMLGSGYSVNDASLQALLAIMCSAEDSTVVHRGGLEALRFVQSSSLAAVALGGVRTEAGRNYLYAMNREFILRGLSPGGCADLLAGTIFVHEAEKELRIHGRA
ncbi:triphosphoribosyl-dephospho-CoA synthase [Marispirochaeta aestuarii]|nr:triphosphoribosyl-dephospho-CoA synthase [Marispirochaeta aestuarii]